MTSIWSLLKKCSYKSVLSQVSNCQIWDNIPAHHNSGLSAILKFSFSCFISKGRRTVLSLIERSDCVRSQPAPPRWRKQRWLTGWDKQSRHNYKRFNLGKWVNVNIQHMTFQHVHTMMLLHIEYNYMTTLLRNLKEKTTMENECAECKSYPTVQRPGNT